MAFKPLAYMGINISGGHRPYTLAAMDADFHLMALSLGKELKVPGFCAGLSSVLVTINAPQRTNKGLMNDPESRLSINQPQNITRSGAAEEGQTNVPVLPPLDEVRLVSADFQPHRLKRQF